MSETDEEFMNRMSPSWPGTNDSVRLPMSDFNRLFALARRGAGLTLDRQKLVLYPDGSEWVEEIYSRFVPLPPPPKGADE